MQYTPIVVPVHTTETKTTGCPAYTVEISSKVIQCMTTEEYNQYTNSNEYIKQQTDDVYIASGLVIFFVLLFGFTFYLISR